MRKPRAAPLPSCPRCGKAGRCRPPMCRECKSRAWRKPKPVDCPICGEKGIQVPPVCPRCRLRPDYRQLLAIALTVWNSHPIALSLQSGPLPGARRLL